MTRRTKQKYCTCCQFRSKLVSVAVKNYFLRRPIFFSCWVLSVWIAYTMSLHCLAISLYSVCFGDILWLEGRLRDVQSKMNCVKVLCAGSESRPWSGWYWANRFSRAGRSLLRVSAVALHLVKMCNKSSSAGCWWDKPLQRRQYGSIPLSCPRLLKQG